MWATFIAADVFHEHAMHQSCSAIIAASAGAHTRVTVLCPSQHTCPDTATLCACCLGLRVCLAAGVGVSLCCVRRQNKLQTPLKEIFSTCLTPDQLRHLLNGPHTQFRASGTATGEALEPLSAAAAHASPTSSSAILFAGLSSPVKQGPDAAAGAVALGTPKGRARGRGRGKSPSAAAAAGGGSGGGGGLFGTPSPGKKKAGAAGSRGQGGMKAFFTTTARCLGCKAVMQSKGPGGSSSSSGGQQPPPGVDPGLCPACQQEDGKREAVYLHTVYEQGVAAGSLSGAHSACRRCHSGGQMGAVVCENGECPVLYVRYQAERQLRSADNRLLRLEW
jgi:hypothetical protein